MVLEKAQITEACTDIVSGFRNWRVWMFLGWTDILLRYRRTIIGPFWMTISTTVMIGTMGVVWGIIFNTDLSTFLPYLAAGLVSWSLMSTIMTESTSAITDRPGSLKDFNLPISYTALRLVVRNFIVFLHNVIVYFAVALIFDPRLAAGVAWVVSSLVERRLGFHLFGNHRCAVPRHSAACDRGHDDPFLSLANPVATPGPRRQSIHRHLQSGNPFY
jgi:ABC-type polysaccharide/polyol phosphate export permease